MTEFVPGLTLAGKFYEEAVRPVLAAEYPALAYSAALIGSGSEILGFDTEMSTDHHWGPRLMLFLAPGDHARFAESITEALRQQLPHRFYGYPTSFSEPDPDDNGVQHLDTRESGPVNHRVDVLTIRDFIRDYLAFDIEQDISAADWLTFPQQKLGTLTGGAVYHDGAGLEAVRQRFAYYPQDVWFYLLAAAWSRVGQEEHLMPRAGFVGDELGSALIGARLVRDAMMLAFLLERRYAPYPKWFGTAFARLQCAPALTPHLHAALHAPSWQRRSHHLNNAYEYLARLHNTFGLTDPIREKAVSFFGRPFNVIHAGEISAALAARITDPAMHQIMQQRVIGSIDQFSDSTDLLENIERRPAVKGLYV